MISMQNFKEDEHVLGIDIGGSKLLLGILNKRGEILTRRNYKWPENMTGDQVIQTLLKKTKEMLEPNKYEISRAGAAIPGLADKEKGLWIFEAAALKQESAAF